MRKAYEELTEETKKKKDKELKEALHKTVEERIGLVSSTKSTEIISRLFQAEDEEEELDRFYKFKELWTKAFYDIRNDKKQTIEKYRMLSALAYFCTTRDQLNTYLSSCGKEDEISRHEWKCTQKYSMRNGVGMAPYVYTTSEVDPRARITEQQVYDTVDLIYSAEIMQVLI